MRELAARQVGWNQLSSRCSAVHLGDLDGDGSLEILAARRDGHLAVFPAQEPPRGRPYQPIGGISGLGLVSTLCQGDLFHQQSSQDVVSVAVICVNGNLSVYKFNRTSPDKVEAVLKFHQLLLSNIHTSEIWDMDGDGREELIVGLTDRIVRSFRYLPDAPSPSTGKDTDILRGRLVPLNKWEVPSQIIGLAVSYPDCGLRETGIYVSQPGGNYIRLKPGTNHGGAEKNVDFFMPNLSEGLSGVNAVFLTENSSRVFLFHALATDIIVVDPRREWSQRLDVTGRVRHLRVLCDSFGDPFIILTANNTGSLHLFRRADDGFQTSPSAIIQIGTDISAITSEFKPSTQQLILAIANSQCEIGLFQISLKMFMK